MRLQTRCGGWGLAGAQGPTSEGFHPAAWRPPAAHVSSDVAVHCLRGGHLDSLRRGRNLRGLSPGASRDRRPNTPGPGQLVVPVKAPNPQTQPQLELQPTRGAPVSRQHIPPSPHQTRPRNHNGQWMWSCRFPEVELTGTHGAFGCVKGDDSARDRVVR